jgi:hypothetical protein
VRDLRPAGPRVAWIPGARDDVVAPDPGSAARWPTSTAAHERGVTVASALLAQCDTNGHLPQSRRGDLQLLAERLEQALA